MKIKQYEKIYDVMATTYPKVMLHAPTDKNISINDIFEANE